MTNLLIGGVFFTFIFFIVDRIFLTETTKVEGFIESTSFNYPLDKELSTEEAFKIADAWNVNVTVQENGAEKKYSCGVSKNRYLKTNELIETFGETGPLPADVYLNSGTIFPGKTCDTANFVPPTDYLEKVSGFAKIKSFHYFGESEEDATKFEIKVDFTMLKEMRRIEIVCPINKKGYSKFSVGKTLLPIVYKNTLGTGDNAYYCEAVHEMKDK